MQESSSLPSGKTTLPKKLESEGTDQSITDSHSFGHQPS